MKTAQEKTQAENTELRLYRLSGSGDVRVRSLTRIHAKALSEARTDGRKWIFDPAAEAGEVTDKPVSNGADWSKECSNSVRLQTLQAQQESHAKGTEVKKNRKNTAPAGLDESGKEWRGLSMCQVIRFCGSKGATLQQAKVICEKAGLSPAKGTITIQLGKGREFEKLPTLSPELAAELLGDVMPPPADTKPKLSKAERKARRAERRAKQAKVGAA